MYQEQKEDNFRPRELSHRSPGRHIVKLHAYTHTVGVELVEVGGITSLGCRIEAPL